MASSAQPARNAAPSSGDPSAGSLLSAADVARMVDRMAHQLIERAAADAPDDDPTGLSGLVLVGIPTRGAPLARRLAARIEAFSGRRCRRRAAPSAPGHGPRGGAGRRGRA